MILLAAGASRRMGAIKQLLPIQGEPSLVFCLRRILKASFAQVVVVVGHHRKLILPVLRDLPVTTAVNSEPDSQMADSVRIGLGALGSDISGVMIGLADHPLVLSSTYELLRKQHEQQTDRIFLPTYLQRGGHPPLFPAVLLGAGKKARPLKEIIAANRDKVEHLPLADPGIFNDMDYPADYHRLLSLAAAERDADGGG
ncbi:MAG: nucleotidyltransferase family protein [Desulfobulbaceae bacterium]|nr:nucleotidyltransferase family protein [Desulfobulbaceae bacterium]